MSDITPPALTAQAVNGGVATFTYNEALETAAPGTPPNSAFAIFVNGVYRAPTSTSVSGSVVTVNFSPVAIAGDVVTASYQPPGTGIPAGAPRNPVPVPQSILDRVASGLRVDQELTTWTADVLRPGDTAVFPGNRDYKLGDSWYIDDKVDVWFDFSAVGARFTVDYLLRDHSNIAVRGGSRLRFQSPRILGNRNRDATVYPRHDAVPGTNDVADYMFGFGLFSVQGVDIIDANIQRTQSDPIFTGADRRPPYDQALYGNIPPCRDVNIIRPYLWNAGRTLGLTHTERCLIQGPGLIDGMFDASIDIEPDTDEGGTPPDAGAWGRYITIEDMEFGTRNFCALAITGNIFPARCGDIILRRCRDKSVADANGGAASLNNIMSLSCFGILNMDIAGDASHTVGPVTCDDNGPFYLRGMAFRYDRCEQSNCTNNEFYFQNSTGCGSQDAVQLNGGSVQGTISGNSPPGENGLAIRVT